MAALIRLNSTAWLGRQVLRNARLISTSKKNQDTAAVCPATTQAKSETAVKKNWVSYGFDFKDEAADRAATNSSFFFTVTLCIVFGTFIYSYIPDPQMRDWAQREGYLALREREAAGKDPICRDYIDPSLVVLPTDEELGDTEIII